MFTSSRTRYAAVLACIAVAILVLGLAFKPKPRPRARKPPPEPAISRAELDNLQDLVRRNSLRRIGTNFASVANNVSPSLFALTSGNPTGIAWEGGRVLVAKPEDALPVHVRAATGDGQDITLAPDVWAPGLPFATMRPSGSPAGAVPLAAALPEPGVWIVAVMSDANGPLLTPGVYGGISETSCGDSLPRQVVSSVALDPQSLGAGVFDLTGNLIGVVGPCPDRPAIVPAGDITAALARLQSAEGQLLQAYGFRFAPAGSPGAAEGPANAAISETWRNWPAEKAGLRPGDIVLAIDGVPVEHAKDAIQQFLAHVDTSRAVRVLRGRSHRTARLQAETGRSDQVATRGVVLNQPLPGVELAQVLPGSSAGIAGLHASDRVLSVDNRRATPSLIAATIGRYRVEEPAFVVVQRRARLLGVTLAP